MVDPKNPNGVVPIPPSTISTYDTSGQKTGTETVGSQDGGAPSSAATGRYPTGYTAPAVAPAAPAQSSQDQAETSYQQSTAPEDPAVIQNRVEGEYSGEIASIKNYYAALTASQNTVNANNSGKTRATASSQGELGQDIGNAEQANTETSNEAALDSITKEEQAAEGTVEGNVASTVESEISSERATGQAAAAQKITYLSQQAQQAQSQIATVAAVTDLASLPQDEYDSLYEASGFSTPEQFNTYYSAVRQSALTGGKTIGDATTGVYQQQQDGTYKKVIPGTAGTVGDPTTGVWQLQSDGTYKNVIPAQPKIGSIGTGGSYVYDPSSGNITTIKPQASQYKSVGGVLYAVDPTTNKATAIASSPSNASGWASTKSGSDQEKAAILSYTNSLGLSKTQSDALTEAIKTNPDAYYSALGNAAQGGFYTNLNVSPGAPGADAAAQDMQDAADNTSNTDTTGGTQ